MIRIDFIYDTIILWILVISTVYLYTKLKEWIYYPPGPYNIPFIGYIPFMLAKHPQELLAKLRYKYGNLFGFHLGNRYIIVINDYTTLKELINKEEFLYRPNIPPISMFSEKSLVKLNGEIFKREKRLSMKILHKLMTENNLLENAIREEIYYLLKDIKKQEGKPCDIRYYLKRSVTNNIAIMLFGRRFHYDDHRSLKLLEVLELFDKCNFYGNPTVFFPFLKPFIYLFGNVNKENFKWSELLKSVISKEVEEHKEQLDENHIRDYIDAYLLEMRKENYFQSDNSLLGNSEAFFIGGGVTTAFSLEWFLIAMAIYQDIQFRCYKEINEIIGLEKPAEMSDLKNLPYIHAVILETFRWKTLAPLSLVRSLGKHVKYNGYILPREAFVFVNIWAIHNDGNYWKKPKEFSPENFIDKDENIINSEFCVPFCNGRRSCPGENIANMEMFLYIVTFLQKYSIHPPDGVNLDTEGISLLTYVSKPFKIVFRPRH